MELLVAPVCSELGTAQPQLVSFNFASYVFGSKIEFYLAVNEVNILVSQIPL
jgi:hypothetical protein